MEALSGEKVKHELIARYPEAFILTRTLTLSLTLTLILTLTLTLTLTLALTLILTLTLTLTLTLSRSLPLTLTLTLTLSLTRTYFCSFSGLRNMPTGIQFSLSSLLSFFIFVKTLAVQTVTNSSVTNESSVLVQRQDKHKID